MGFKKILLLLFYLLTLVFSKELEEIEESEIKGREKRQVETTLDPLQNGWVLRNPYFGMILIALENHQKVWPIPPVIYGSMAYEYGMQSIDELSRVVESLSNEPNFFYTNTIYTNEVNGTGITSDMAKLETKFKRLNYHLSHPGSLQEMNSKVSEQTYGRIKQFIPIGDFPTPNFASATSAVFVTTFYYKNLWKDEVKLIGQGKFKNDDGKEELVKYLQFEGDFQIFEYPDQSAFGINIPLKHEKRYIRLTKYQNLKKYPLRISSGQKLRLIVPQLNITSYGFLNYEKYGISFCNIGEGLGTSKSGRYFMQPVVQEHSLELNSGGFLFTSASGNQITHSESYMNELIQVGIYPPNYEQIKAEAKEADSSASIIQREETMEDSGPAESEMSSEEETITVFENIMNSGESGEKSVAFNRQKSKESGKKKGYKNKKKNKKNKKKKNKGKKNNQNQKMNENSEDDEDTMRKARAEMMMILRHDKGAVKMTEKDEAFNIIFDRPFSVSLFDPNHGDIALADVASVLGFLYRKKVGVFGKKNDNSKILLDKYERWICA